MKKFVFLWLFVLIAFEVSSFAEMSLDDLVDLYVMQKDYHIDKNSPSGKDFPSRYLRVISEAEVEISEVEAPALPKFSGQPNIPFILFKPKAATPESPQPLIIHTHGGPGVYMSANNPHAEIAYYLSKGFVVACPNYRGTPFPYFSKFQIDWSWLDQSKNKHHILGPEDVYAVTKQMLHFPYVKKDKVFLRGGSFGSHINSHLLAGVAKGLFEPLYAGAHFMGGVHYPVSSNLPFNVPILLTHGARDQIASFDDARIFMEKMLFIQGLKEMEGKPTQVQVFIARHGDHHLIDPDLKYGDHESASYFELKTYLGMATQFIEGLSRGESLKITPATDQLLHLQEFGKDPEKQNQVLWTRKLKAYRHVMSQKSEKRAGQIQSEVPSVCPQMKQESSNSLSPTLAHLKLVLKEKYTGDVRKDLTTFFQSHFVPIDWETREPVLFAGTRMLSDRDFFEQIVHVIEREKAFIAGHPDQMVFYHTATLSSVQLYTFIGLWKAALKGLPFETLQKIEEMRPFDFMSQSFEDIHSFLKRMRYQKDHCSKDTIFNNVPGFADRAISCNIALTANQHTTASSSLWWYFKSEGLDERAPLEQTIGAFLGSLGINDPERVQRYLKLFEREKYTLKHLGLNQTLLQQIFIPYKFAEKSSYLCQIWGEEFGKNEMNLANPRSVKSFCSDPVAFESSLQANKSAFRNLGDLEGFGDVQAGFLYSNTLQARYLLQSKTVGSDQIAIQTFIRREAIFKELVQNLVQLIKEDYADFLAHDKNPPDSFTPGAEKATNEIRRLLEIDSKSEYSDEALLALQKELFKDTVRNQSPDVYGQAFIGLPKERKQNLQVMLGSLRESSHFQSVFRLCTYLKGYTYYDLLSEAAQAVYLDDPKISKSEKAGLRDIYYEMMMELERFTNPTSIDKEEIGSNRYLRFTMQLRSLKEYRYNPEMHQFFQPRVGQVYEDYLFNSELSSAIEAVLRNARLAKERRQGHDISGRDH